MSLTFCLATGPAHIQFPLMSLSKGFGITLVFIFFVLFLFYKHFGSIPTMIFLFLVSLKGFTPRCTMGFFSSVLNLLLIWCAVRNFLYVPGWRCGAYPFDWFSLLLGVWFSGLFGSVTDLPWIYGSLYFQATDSYLFLLFYSRQNSHLEVNGDIFVSVISHLNEIPGSKKEERRCMDSLFISCAVKKFLYFAAWSIGYVIIPRG